MMFFLTLNSGYWSVSFLEGLNGLINHRSSWPLDHADVKTWR